LRGHFLNTNPAGWDLLSNIASQKWGAVVLQDLSDEPLPLNKGSNANLGIFNFYTNKLEDYIHQGIKAGPELAAACIAGTGGPSNPNALSQTACSTARTIRGNPNESSTTDAYLSRRGRAPT